MNDTNATLDPNASAAVDPEILNDVSDERPAAAVAVRGNSLPGVASFLPDTKANITRAVLEIVYGVGESSSAGLPTGALALVTGKKGSKIYTMVSKPKEPTVVIVTSAREVWREWKKYEPDVFPREYSSEKYANRGIDIKMELELTALLAQPGDSDEVVASKTEKRKAILARAEPKTTTWTGPYPGGTPPQASGCLYLELLVQKPENVTSPLFCLFLDGKWYAPAWMRVDGTRYRKVKDALYTASITDASARGVPQKEGRVDSIFHTLAAFVRPDGEKTKTSLILGQYTTPDGRTVPVSEKVKADMVALLNGPAIENEEMDDIQF